MNFCSNYLNIDEPITEINCSKKCAPYNEKAVSFCRDLEEVVFSLYKEEWDNFKEETDLRYLWKQSDNNLFRSLAQKLPDGHILNKGFGYE